MRLRLLILAGLMSMAVVACGGAPTKIYLGTPVSGTLTSSDANVEGWKSKPYVIDVREGIEYFVQLAGKNGNNIGIWSTEADGYLVEIDSEVTARTSLYTFSETGPQELFLRSPDSEVPSPFTFRVWTR